MARTLEAALFDGIFLADVVGVYDVYGGHADAALRGGGAGAGERPDAADPGDGRGHAAPGLRRHRQPGLRGALSRSPAACRRWTT
jgi:hypothetical protein